MSATLQCQLPFTDICTIVNTYQNWWTFEINKNNASTYLTSIILKDVCA